MCVNIFVCVCVSRQAMMLILMCVYSGIPAIGVPGSLRGLCYQHFSVSGPSLFYSSCDRTTFVTDPIIFSLDLILILRA